MGRNQKIAIILCSVLLLFGAAAFGRGLFQKDVLPENKPADFNFVLNYGVLAKNQLDTQNGTYKKDMVVGTELTTQLKLSDEEMNQIYSEMKKINILQYPDNFDEESNAIATPSLIYQIKITANGKDKTIYWNDQHESKTQKAVQLRNLFDLINKMVYEKEEYKKLPEPFGGYI